MTRIKTLGLALVAVFAMSALVASAAQAANEFMTEGNVNATVIANQVAEEQHEFQVEGESTEVNCKKAHFETQNAAGEPVEIGSPTTEVTVTPEYGECKAFLGLNATVENTGCHYLIVITDWTHWTFGTLTTTGWAVDIFLICTGGAKITITAGTCKASVGGEQEFSATQNRFMNIEGGKGELVSEVTGIKVNKEKDGFLCPLNGTGEVETGTYTGNTIVEAKHEEEAVNITGEGEE